jgi:cytochrome P450
LRMNQSERLMRHVEQDISFDGVFIPRGWRVRVCLWEAHKDPTAFADPFVFDADRFLPMGPSPDEYSPFGLDRHQCPFASLSLDLASRFVACLARDFEITPENIGPPVRGGYHWEPAIGFGVRLTAVSSSGASNV